MHTSHLSFSAKDVNKPKMSQALASFLFISMAEVTAVSRYNQRSTTESPLIFGRDDCFHAVNLTEPMSSLTCNTSGLVPFSLLEFWTHQQFPLMCRQREKYGKIIECVVEATKICLSPEIRLHIQDGSKARGGLHYICNVAEADQFDVNMTCAQTYLREVFDCVKRDIQLLTGHAYLHSSVPPHLICRTYDIADLCCWERLQICGEQTAAAYTRMMSFYLRPSTCSSVATRPVHFFTLLVLMLTVYTDSIAAF